MPIQQETYHGELLYDPEKHQAHWGNCTGIERVKADQKENMEVPLTPRERKIRGIE